MKTFLTATVYYWASMNQLNPNGRPSTLKKRSSPGGDWRFDGMHAGDSAAVKRHFYLQVSANSAFTSKEGLRQLKVDDIDNWFNAIQLNLYSTHDKNRPTTENSL